MNILKIFISLFLCLILFTSSFFIKAYRIDTSNDYDILHSHQMALWEKYFYLYRLQLNFNENIYNSLKSSFILNDSCNNCEVYMSKFFVLGLKNINNTSINYDIYFYLDNLYKSHSKKNIDIENLILSIHLNKDKKLYYYYCDYKKYNTFFANEIKKKYNVSDDNCEEK